MRMDIARMDQYRGLVGFVHGFQIGKISPDKVYHEYVLEPDDPTLPSVRVDEAFMLTYKPEVGGFYVVSDTSGIAFYYPGQLFNRTFGKVTGNEANSQEVGAESVQRLIKELLEKRRWISGALEVMGLDDNDFNAERLKLICRTLKDDLRGKKDLVETLERKLGELEKKNAALEQEIAEHRRNFRIQVDAICNLQDEVDKSREKVKADAQGIPAQSLGGLKPKGVSLVCLFPEGTNLYALDDTGRPWAYSHMAHEWQIRTKGLE
jgi:hypothetical protein